MTADLQEKVCIVSGAASGIGREMALLAALQGARIVATDINVAGGEETLKRIHDAGGDAIFIRADVTVEEEVAAVVEQAVARFGRLDCAFNNAGMPPNATMLHEMTTQSWQRIIDVNLTSMFCSMKYQLRAMLANGSGSIVNVTSIAGLVGVALGSDYTASKHGIVGLTKAAALDYAALGIRINSIAPGGTKTPMLIQAWEADPSFRKITETAHPIGRAGDPGEIANAAIWLLSDKASFVTGVCLPVDGGYTAR